jgi:ATP-binding cassette subfamily B protein
MDAQKKNPLLYLFGKTWRYSESNRKNIVLYWTMFIGSELVNTFWTPIVASKIIGVVSTEGITKESLKTLYFLLFLMMLRVLLSWAFHGPARILEQTNAFIARSNYRKYLLRGVMNMPLEWHTDHHSGDTIDKINRGTNALYDFSEDSFQVIKSLVKLVSCFAVIVYFSHVAGVVVLIMMLLSAWITMRFDTVIIPQYKILNKSENQISESIFDSVSNISTVIILRVEKLVFEAIMHKVMKPFELFKKNNSQNEWKWFFTSVCCNSMTIVVLGLYFYQNLGAPAGVLVGSAFLLISYLDRMSELFYNFTSMYSQIVRRKFRVINAEELSDDFQTQSFTNHVLPTDWKELQIEGLNFSYSVEGSQSLHLDDVNMRIKRGARIAFVGETGSGKTTLLKIMRDLYPPKSLTLKVDGGVIEEGFGGIARAIALVPQNPEIFSRTIFENITLGAEYDVNFVERYTDMACFTHVVHGLPKKFDSSIKEKGVNLSGGQVQRLALSRGLLACHDKDIVLLDEPTSSLDFTTEMEVYRNIFAKFQGKTVISSIHRLHLLPLFDKIYFFDKGRIVASGTLSELISSNDKFRNLWESQYLE